MIYNERIIIRICALLLVSAVLAGCSERATAQLEDVDVTMFKTPACGCCGTYASYMEGKGFDVEIRDTKDMDAIRAKHNIPLKVQSCHTTVIGKYFVEGHVPVEAIGKLLTENPDIAGIALPGMPVGVPGMPGTKEGPFSIIAVHKDGSTSEFMQF